MALTQYECKSIIHIAESEQGPYEVKLIEMLLSKSQHMMLSRPVRDEENAVDVSFGIFLQQIVGVVSKLSIVVTNSFKMYLILIELVVFILLITCIVL